MKRIISVICVLALTLTSFAACSTADDTGADDTTAAPVTTAAESIEPEETRLSLNIPEDVDYEGGTFVINQLDYTGTVDDVLYCPFNVAEEDGEVMNDTTFRAMNEVRDLLNIELTYTYHNNYIDASYLRKLASAGDTSVDAVRLVDRFGVALVANNHLVSYQDIPTIDLSNPWWFQDVNSAISIGGRLCFAMGAMNMDSTNMMNTLAFNKQTQLDYNLENPYELVRSGKWTIDNYHAMMKPVISELDGDGEWDEHDQYGVCYTHDVYYNVFASVSGENIVLKDSDDQPYFAVFGNERLLSIWQKIYDYTQNGYGYDVCVAGQTDFATSATNTYSEPTMMFKAGKALFTGMNSLSNYQLLRDMEDDFGVLPFPTYEEKEAGEAYGSYVGGIGQPYFVPNSGLDLERVGHVFEAICYQYYYNIIPKYLELVAFNKQIRDEDSLEMLQMMNERRMIDFAAGYWWESTYLPFYDIFCRNKGEFVSSYTKQEKLINKAIEKLSDAFAESYGN